MTAWHVKIKMMDTEFESLPAKELLPRNQASQRLHHRESWLQIGLPFAVVAILLVALTSWLVASGRGEVGSLAQIATMLLAGIGILVGLLMLAILGLGVFALARLMSWLPPQAFRAQKAIRQMNARVIQASDMMARPILLLDSWQKAAGRVFRRRR